MSLYLVRAGSKGEFEDNFLQDNRVYLRWGGAFPNRNIAKMADYEQIKTAMIAQNPDEQVRKLINGAGQINAFVHTMQIGDWIVLPLKRKAAIAVGEITSAYTFDPRAEEDFRHFRNVRWLNTSIPRNVFDKDLLFSFGAFMTVCRITRNDAENRVKRLAANNWQASANILGDVARTVGGDTGQAHEDSAPLDLEELARDQLSELIRRKFKGIAMERLVEGILKAQGFVTWRTPEEKRDKRDKSIDILAARGDLGFDAPRICVQVKSGQDPMDRPTLDQLRGAMTRSKAEKGLLVAWGGFTRTVEEEIPVQFFDVRLWDEQELIAQLLNVYEKLDADLRAELPLKRVWLPTASQEEM